MEVEVLEYSLFIVYCGAAALATIALYTRQVLTVVYIILGALIGPGGFKLIPELALVEDLAHVGIIFLLFLLGVDLYPQKLLKIFQSVSVVMVVTSGIFILMGFGVGVFFGFTFTESVIIGVATGFSSTIIGIKLLPTTVLHHRHTGELMIGILLLQDMLAIAALVGIDWLGDFSDLQLSSFMPIVALPLFVAAAFIVERYIIRKLFQKFEQIIEYIFLMTIAWCLGLGYLASKVGLSAEIGAFIAGISFAASPIARYIAERLHAIRDFFLILFFVAIGAHFDSGAFADVIVPAVALSVLVLLVKPTCYRFMLTKIGETKELGWEVGFRLGQLSEFSILVVFMAIASGVISEMAANFLLISTVITFVISSYIIVFRYPSPVAVSERLRRN